ncbi:MAG TPA: hypothetical protein VGH11_10960 [Jatrophihabitans sp.]|jgi:hypothetical protein
MARALLGHLATTQDRYLLEEVARLKSQVRDLESEVAELKSAAESHQFLDELQRMTTSASALA